jgi:autophagy-related protein 17
MDRDTDELPSIMNELEDCLFSINATKCVIRGTHVLSLNLTRPVCSELLVNSQEEAKKNLAHLHTILDDLDELGEIMTEMLQTQEAVEVCSSTPRCIDLICVPERM